MNEQPSYEELHALCQNMLYQNSQLKRANSRLRNDLRFTRKELATLQKNTRKEKLHYRNGQKRGRTMNG